MMVKRLGLLLILALAIGCASQTPPIRNASFGNQRDGIFGYRGRTLQFFILTDGQIPEWGSSNSITGPNWSGIIKPAEIGGHTITFDCGLYHMTINNQDYSLANGNAFVISTKNPEPIIRQFDISAEDQVRSIVQTDRRFSM